MILSADTAGIMLNNTADRYTKQSVLRELIWVFEMTMTNVWQARIAGRDTTGGTMEKFPTFSLIYILGREHVFVKPRGACGIS